MSFQYTIAMMGYGPEDKNVVLELTYNYGVTDYDKGNAYAQVDNFSLCFIYLFIFFLKHVRQNVLHLSACKILNCTLYVIF